MKLIFLLISLLGCLNTNAADIHITPDSSLADAVRKAREMRRLGQAQEITIHLAAGTYQLYEPLRLRPEDSGLNIVGEKAIISGGIEIKWPTCPTSTAVPSTSVSCGSTARRQSVPVT